MSGIITEVSKYQKGWTGGLPETVCGYGSKLSSTEKQRAWIPLIIEKYNIKSIADIGAGDLNWISKTDLKGAEYTPYDLVPRAPEVIQFDLLKNKAPKADLIMCFWVLNHLPFDHCKEAIKNIRKSGAKYLMMTYVERYRKDQPDDIDMPFIEELHVSELMGSIRLIEL